LQQLHSLVPRQRRFIGIGGGQVHRADGQHRFTGQAQRLAAGAQQGQAGQCGQQTLDQRGHGLQQVFAVVQHGQPGPPGQVLLQRLFGQLAGGGPAAQRVGQRGQQRIGAAQRGQVHPSHAALALGGLLVRQALRQPRLARPAQAHQREQAPIDQVAADLRQQRRSVDEAAALGWQLAGQVGLAQR
jgi:hypothetical protein